MGNKYDNHKKQNYKSNGKKNFHAMDSFMESLKDEIFRQMDEFKVAHESLENLDSNAQIAVEKELFMFPTYPTTLNAPIPEDSGITELFDLPDERGIFAYAIKLLKISGYILCLIHAELPI